MKKVGHGGDHENARRENEKEEREKKMMSRNGDELGTIYGDEKLLGRDEASEFPILSVSVSANWGFELAFRWGFVREGKDRYEQAM